MSRHQILSSTKSIIGTVTRLRRGHFWPAALLLVLGLTIIFGSEPRVAGLGGFGYATRAQQDGAPQDGRQDPPPASNPAIIPSETQQTCTLDCNATVPATGTVGVAVNFQGSATATNCSTSPSYSWTFGDGGTSTQQNPSRAYSSTGTFSWSMTVTASGSGGGSSAISTVVGGEGEGLPATQVSYNRLNAVVRDPQGRGIYLAANNLSSKSDGEYIYFINTGNTTVSLAGKTFAPGIARIIAGGGQFTDENISAFNTNLISITGLGVSPDGNVVYYVDTNQSRVRALNVGGSTVTVGGGSLSPGNIRTVSGSGFGSFPSLYGLAVNPADGSIYTASISSSDSGGNRVYRVAASTGNTSVAVGSGALVTFDDPFEGNGTSAGGVKLFQANAVDFDTNGNLIVADTKHGRVIRVAAPANSSSATTLMAQIPNEGIRPFPNGLGTVGTNVYVASGDIQTIRLANGGGGQLVSGQYLTSCNFANSPNSCGDGGPISGATYALYGNTSTLPVAGMDGDASGVYLIDQSPNTRARVRYLNFSGSPVTLAGVTIAPGTIQTITGTGLAAELPLGVQSGPRHYDGGAATGAFLDLPLGVGVGSTGNLWLTDALSNRLRFVNREASPVTLFAGTPAQQVVAPGTIVTVNNGEFDAGDVVNAHQAQLNEPQGVFVNSQGVFVADTIGGPTIPSNFGQRTSQLKFFNTSASNVTFYPNSGSPLSVPPGTMARIAGCPPAPTPCADNGLARTTKFIGITDVAVASNGDIYVTDVGQNAVRRISASNGAVSSLSTPFSRITGLGFGPDGRLYLTDTQAGNLLRATDATNTNFVTLGTGLGSPRDVAVAADGTAYVTSATNSRVLAVSAAGAVSTFVGTTAGFSGDGGPPASAQVNFNVSNFNVSTNTTANLLPRTINIVSNAAGEIFFADPENGRIRRVGGGAGGASCVRSGTIQINSTNNPVPTTTSLSPTQTLVGGNGFVLTVNGTNFINGSTVRWNGNNRTTTFVSSTQLQAQIPATDIASAGSATVTVFNPAPGGGPSNGQTFTITNPAPTTTSLSPGSAVAGGAGFTLNVFGSNFVSTSTVNWNGSPRTTTFVNSGQLSAAIPASDIANTGTANITVTNPTPGGGTSTPALTFNITTVAQGLEGDVAPRPGGNGAVSLADWVQVGRFAAGLDTVNVGTEFQRADAAPLATLGNGSVSLADWVQVGRFAAALDAVPAAGGPTGPPGFAPNTEFRAVASVASVPDQTRPVRVIPTTITRGQNGTITIELTTTSGENAISFTVNFDTTQLVYVPPAGGNNNLLINFNSNGMPANSAIVVNDGQLNQGRLGILLSAPFGQAIPAGVRQILNLTFMATTSGSGNSTSVGFGNTPVVQELTDVNAGNLAVSFTAGTITLLAGNNPVPSVTSINPTSVNAGSASFTLTVNGTNFINGSVVRVNGSDRTTTFVNATQLTAAITAADVQNGGMLTVTVFNPPPGGGTSPTGQTLTVVAQNNPVPTVTSINPTSTTAGSGAFALTVNGTNFVPGSVVKWNGSDRMTTFNSATQLTAAITAADVQNAGASTITVFNPEPGGGLTQNGIVFTINAAQNPVPTLTSLNPTSINAGSGGFSLIVMGTNFLANSVVRFNGSDRVTTFNSATQLTAAITAADVQNAGSPTITVFNPAPGGGASNGLTFTINAAQNPVPSISSLNPTSVSAGSGAFSLVVNGSNFVAGSVVRWNGSNRTTTFNSATQLTAAITAADVQNAGTSTITVFNPAPGGGTSNNATFTISVAQNPAPTITSINPNLVTAGGAGFNLVVTGTNFIATSVVRVNGNSRPTTFNSATQLTAAITAADIASAGTANITVFNPAPGGGTSNTVGLTVNAAGTSIVRVVGATIQRGTSGTVAVELVSTGLENAVGFTLTFNQSELGFASGAAGSGTAGAQVNINSANASSGVLVVNIAQSPGVAFQAGTRQLVTINFNALAGGTAQTTPIAFANTPVVSEVISVGAQTLPSNFQAGTVTISQGQNPVPTITNITPTSANLNSAAFALTVNGTNFVNGSVVNINGSPRTTTFVNGTQLTAAILATDLQSAGAKNITVTNPAPGGGTSNAVTFTVIDPSNPLPSITNVNPSSVTAGSGALTVTITGTNFVNGSTVQFNGIPQATTFVNSTQLTVQIQASSLTTAGTANIIVINPAPGGGNSNSFLFTINNPAPTVTTITPNSVSAGSAAFTLQVNGTNFTPNSVILFNGSARTTNFVSPTQVTAMISENDVAAVGTAAITVQNPAPGGGTSNVVNFAISAGGNLPVITSLDPNTATAGGPAFQLRVIGSNFTPASKVRWNGMERNTSFDNANQLTATIPASDIAQGGTATVTVFIAGINGGSSNPATFTIQGPAPAPTLTSLNPSSVAAGSAAFTLTVTGTNFVNGSTVQINGSPRATTFVSATQLTAQVLASDVAAQGGATVRVSNPAPGGGLSNELILTITAANPVPSLTSLNPASVLAGSAAFTLQVNGTNFINGSVIRVNGADRATTFISSAQLTTQISAAEVANGGSLSITVFTPGPGGGTSNALALTIQGPNGVPAITGLSPSAAVTGGQAFTLTVAGANFVNGSVVRWNGQDRPTTFVGPTQLTAQIPASDLAQAGTNVVTVFTPAPGGGTSNGFNFVVGNPNQAPTLTSLSPNSLPALSGNFELTVNGANFANGAVVEWNGAARPTVFVSATQLKAQIPASDLIFTGTASITVSNPPPGGGRSTALSFTITNPIPVISALNPSLALVGSPGFALIVTGMNFSEGSIVRVNGQNRPTTFANSTQLTAQIPASDLTAVGTLAITVFTPAPGGGISNTVNFSVVTPNQTPTLTSINPSFAAVGGNAFTLTVNGANFVNGAVVQWNGQTRPTTFVSSTQLTAQIPASDIAFEGTASVTVVNPAPGGGTSLALKFTIGRALALVNAASFTPNGPVAPDSIVAAFGTSLATGNASASQVPLPTSLLGTSVTVRDANGTERTAGLFAVAPGQVNFLMPAGTALGTAVVTINSPNGSVSVGQVQVNRIAPGIFSANSNGQGVAAARLFRRRANGQITDEPVAQLSEGGQLIPIPIDLGPETDEVFLVFFGTGIRGRLNQADVTAQIGGVNIPIAFAAAQGGFAGLDQVNTARLPRTLIGRGLVNVVISVEGQPANTVQVNFR